MEMRKRTGNAYAPSPSFLVALVVLQSLTTTALCSQRLEQGAFSDQKSYYTPTPTVPHPYPHYKPTPSHPSPPTPSYGGGGNTPTPTGGYPPVVPYPPPPDSPTFQPGTCSYWIAHPGKIVAVIGYAGTLGDIFGTGCVLAFGGKNPSLPDALANTRVDGIGELVREGTAALLNSMACKGFPLSPGQVKGAFVSALVSDGAAAAQAEVFKLANEGRYVHKA